MTDGNHKLRAILLATIMVTSVFAGVLAFSGSAAATRGTLETDGETFNKTVFSGNVTFLGEDVDAAGNLTNNQTLTLNGESSETLDLTSPIPQDGQPTGRYTVDGSSAIDDTNNPGVILRQPRISDAEIQTPSGGDVTGATLGQENANNLTIAADYNYDNAEFVEVTVENPDGTDITQEVLNDTAKVDGDEFIENSSVDTDSSQAGAVQIDMSDQDAGEYSIILEGTEDLDFGSATETLTLTISGDDDPTIELDSDTATQGDNVRFTVGNGLDGDKHLVAIEASDIEDGANATDVFRNVGDTTPINNSTSVSRGYAADGQNTPLADNNLAGADIAFASIEIDGSSGVGSIETQFLDDTDVDVYVYDANSTFTSPANTFNNLGTIAGNPASESVDDQTLEVEEGGLEINSPSGSYIAGSDVDVNGTATSADDVIFYVRSNAQYQRINISGDGVINVESDDTFEEEDVTLSNPDGTANLLSQTGTYRLGVIDANDADVSSSDNGNDPDITIPQTDFAEATSETVSLRVTGQALEGQFSTVNGQVAPVGSGVTDISGTATGQDQVLVIFVDNRGNAGTEVISVDNDGSFDEEDVAVDSGQDLTGASLSEGVVTAHILSAGRDDVFGDTDNITSSVNGNDIQAVQDFVGNIEGGSSDGGQVNELIAANTVEETASDDLIVTQTFRLSESATSINTVRAEEADATGLNPVAVGETMIVSGTTNLRPDDNTITVEVTDGDGNTLGLVDTDEWDTESGQFSVAIDTSDFETGTVTVEADDGDNTDVVDVEIVEERAQVTETATPEPDTETPEPDTETPEPDTETPEPDTEEPTDEPTETDTGTPGFGVVVALAALLAAALLAVRRNN